MRSSRGEIMIEEILTEAGLNFEEEYIFPELKSNNGRPLRFDFAVFDDDGHLDFLIEYQGIQHYQPKEKFGGWSGLQKQQFNDLKKREYCKKHNITLVIIPYTDENIIDYDYIMTKAGYQEEFIMHNLRKTEVVHRDVGMRLLYYRDEYPIKP